MDYKQSTSEWGICMRNVTARHRHWREKRINARHSLSGARLISSLPNSRVHTCPLYAPFIHMHLLARRHSMSSNPLMQSGFKQPWLISSTQHHPPTLTAVSFTSPREAEGVRPLYPDHSFILQSSAVRTHIAVARAVECLRVGDQIRDLPVVIRGFAQDCVQMHVQMIPRGSQRVVNDSHHPPFHKKLL